jgi:hypothetical protein
MSFVNSKAQPVQQPHREHKREPSAGKAQKNAPMLKFNIGSNNNFILKNSNIVIQQNTGAAAPTNHGIPA